MRTVFSLKEILAEAITGYVGDCFFVHDESTSDRLLNFIKGPLEWIPRDFKHPMYRTKHRQSAAYILHEVVSNSVYVGSSEEVYDRVAKHKFYITSKKHDNPKFTALINCEERKEFHLTILFASSREDAYSLEQQLLDDFRSGVYCNVNVINTAVDVRYAMLGHKQTEEHKEKLRIAKTGKTASEETRAKMSTYRKESPEAKAQFQKLIDDRKRAISVNGVEYISLRHAALGTGIPEIQIRRRVNKGDPDIRWIGENESPLKGKKLSPEQIQKYKDSPYNAERTRRLIEQNATRRKPVCVNGVHYVSSSEASRQLMGKISGKVLHHYLKTELSVIDGVRHVTIPITR